MMRACPGSRTPRGAGATPATGRSYQRALLLAAIVAGAVLRVWPAGTSLVHAARPSGDDDAAYHVLRAERMARGAPGAPWIDPHLNHPFGAPIPWPPLFDAIIAAGGTAVALGGEPTRSDFELFAAWLPVILGIAAIPVVALLARALAADAVLEAAWLAALLPANAVFSMIGRADQHVLELLASCLVFLSIARGLANPSRSRRGTVLLLGTSLAIAFWNWMGSGLYPLLVSAFAGIWFVASSPEAPSVRRLAADLRDGAALGAALLAASLALARGPAALAEMSVLGISGFHVLLVALVAVYGAALSLAPRLRAATATPLRRAVWVGAAGLVPLGAAMALPGFRSAVARGVAGLARTNAWYANVVEFDPLLFAGFVPVTAELREVLGLYGLALFAMPIAGAVLVRRLARDERRAALAFLLAWGAGFLALAIARKRFALYVVPPLALWVGMAVRSAARALAARVGIPRAAPALAALGIAGLVGPAIALAPENLIQYETARPVLVTPFGTEGGGGAMEDAAAFFLETDPARAEAVLDRRQIGLVVLDDPLTEARPIRGAGGSRRSARLPAPASS